MKENPNIIYPLKGRKVTYIKPTIKNKEKIIVGDYSYYADDNFEKQVTHCYPWYKEKLVIGKFCAIAQGVEFMMNGANHCMNGASCYPFYIFKGWKYKPWPKQKLTIKGDTIIGNDVWIGQNAVILPGVKIGDGVDWDNHILILNKTQFVNLSSLYQGRRNDNDIKQDCLSSLLNSFNQQKWTIK